MGANEEFVRSIFTAWEQGDFSSTDWADPDIELTIADGPAPGHLKGLSSVSEGFAAFMSGIEGYTTAAEGFLEIDANRVVVWVRVSGKGKGSGLDLASLGTRGLNLFEVRDRKVTRLVLWFDRERGLAEVERLDRAPATAESDLVGAWRLLSFEGEPVAGGERTQPMGAEARGRLIYTAEGWMSALLSGEDVSETARGGALAYCGRWHLDGRKVVHEVELSTAPDFVGVSLVRYVELEGDALTLRTPEVEREGRRVAFELRWEREAPAT